MKRRIDTTVKRFQYDILRKVRASEKWIWKWHSRMIKETSRRQSKVWVKIRREEKIAQRNWKGYFSMNFWTWKRKCSSSRKTFKCWMKNEWWTKIKRMRIKWDKIKVSGIRCQINR